MNRIKFLIIPSILVLTVIFSLNCFADKVYDKPAVIIGNQKVKIKIADTPASRAQGLMQVSRMPENEGMLFIFDKQQKATFWMKDCLIPLDIIFIKANKIVNMYTSVPVCKESPCQLYPSVEPIDKALEVNSGFIKKHRVKINDTVEFIGL